ncbi:hypothetical protein [Thermodesulfovibrio sp.]|uniref:hypothetical protein n=1 Tax=Thermodesulfovibrio sp. TaxID=2067987 RepID=UPI0030AFDD4F
MRLKEKFSAQIFLYVIGFVLTTIELLLNVYGKSICRTEGCRIVESFVRGGEAILLLGGVLLFGALIFLTFSKKLQSLHSILLISALSVEGYLLGFQSFILKEFCLFCITIFVILFFSALIRFLRGRRELAYAFISFISVFFITYIVNPQLNEIPSSKYVLVYSSNCPKCKEVIQYCEQMSIPVQKIDVKEVTAILRALNINSVPILFCDEGVEKKFIVGADKIKNYLLVKAVPKQEAGEVCPIFSPADCK